MKRLVTAVLAAGVLAGAAVPARANLKLDAWRGHISLGYSYAAIDSLAPPGSMAVGGGVDYPLAPGWRIGPSLSFNLLGSSTVTRGSITAGLDHSLFEGSLMFTHLNQRGPVARWAVGPGFASPRRDLAVSAGGAGFRDLSVGGVHPELAADATFMSRKPAIVAAGLEVGARVIPVPSQSTWVLLTLRLVVHY